jgi:beta-lactamase superfamily II metal-dependent hydrolase
MRSAILTIPALAAALVCAAPALPQARQRPLDIYFIDVEGGAATLTVTPAGESVLVDSGWPRADGRDAKRIEHVARYVAGLGAIDHYVTTHWHTDHYGGIEALAKIMPVKTYWDRGIPERASDGARDFPMLIEAYKRANRGKSNALKPGGRVPLRGAEMKVVSGGGKVIGQGDETLPGTCEKHPAGPAPDESDNKLSLGFLLTSARFQFLNLGDLTWDLEHALVCPKNRVGQVDLWQVTHHGWHASGNPAVVEATRPNCAVMVNGPRKGASASVVRMIKQAPSVQALYQLHRNVLTGLEDNTAAELTANPEERCSAEFIRARLQPGADRYTVTIGTYRSARTFDTR